MNSSHYPDHHNQPLSTFSANCPITITNTRTTTSFSDLPHEIHQSIANHLWPNDYVSCVQVNRSWHNTFRTIIWRHITLNQVLSTHDSPFMKSIIHQGSFNSHGHLIHSLKLKIDECCLKAFLKHSPINALSCLESIAFCGTGVYDGTLAEFIGRCHRGLREFSSYFYSSGPPFGFGPLSVIELLKHARTLESVVLREAGRGISSRDIQKLLCSAPRLHALEILDRPWLETESDVGWICALDLVKSEWVCAGLRVFRCQIRGVPRPDILTEDEKMTNEVTIVSASRPKIMTLEESIGLQQRVYKQLGRLTQLEILDLGSSRKFEAIPHTLLNTEWSSKGIGQEDVKAQRYRMKDCLAMSLESGLSLLKDLNHLKILRLSAMEVGIHNKEEMAWIAREWPQLETLSAHYE